MAMPWKFWNFIWNIGFHLAYLPGLQECFWGFHFKVAGLGSHFQMIFLDQQPVQMETKLLFRRQIWQTGADSMGKFWWLIPTDGDSFLVLKKKKMVDGWYASTEQRNILMRRYFGSHILQLYLRML